MTITGYRTVVKPSPQVRELKRILDRWREPGMQNVTSNLIVPDTSNRDHTGLSDDHGPNHTLSFPPMHCCIYRLTFPCSITKRSSSDKL